MPSFDGGDDFVWVLGPGKGLWVGVDVGEEAVDGGFEFLDGSEDAALEAPVGELGEEALNGVEPGSRCRREVEDEAGMAFEPRQDVGMLMGSVVVDDDVDSLFRGHSGVNGIEEADELLMAMTLHALADHPAFEHVEGGKQGGDAMTLVNHGS